MAFDSGSTLQQTDEVAAVAASGDSAVGGGGSATNWDGLSGTLSGDVPFETVDSDDNPAPRGMSFVGAGEDIQWQRDPAGDLAFEVRDTTNGNRLLWLDDNGRLHTRRDQEAFADGSGSAASGVNSLLQVEDPNQVLTTDAASLTFTGSGVSVTGSGDEVIVDISGGSGSDIDIEQNQTPVVGGATGLSFEGSGVDDVTNDGDGTATVSISKGSSTEVQQGGTQQVSDVTTLDFVNDFSVSNLSSGEAEIELANNTMTVAGNNVPLGGSTGIAHGDLGSIAPSDHHTKYTDSEAVSAVNNDDDHGSTASHNYTTSAAGLSDVSPDSTPDAHHAVFEPSDYTPESDTHSRYSDSEAVSALQSHDGTNVRADKLDGVDLNNIGFGDISASRYTDSEAVNALQSHDGTNVNADTLDGAEGSNYARLGQDETVTGAYDFENGDLRFGNASNKSEVFANSSFVISSDRAVEITGDGQRGAGSTLFAIFGRWDGNNVGGIQFRSGDDSTNKDDGRIAFRTRESGDSSLTERMRIEPNGSVGILESNPSYALEAAGDIRSTGEQEAFLGSDRRLKTGITPVASALDKVGQLTGSHFQWHEGDSVQPHKRGKADVGLIAQDVEDVLPEAVRKFEDGHSEGYKAVQYDKVVPLLVEAIKDLRSQVQELR